MVSSYWSFRDYCSDDGVNHIRSAGETYSNKVRARINTQIQDMRNMRVLQRPYFAKLKHDCAGLYAIRFCVDNVQHRILCCKGPKENEYTLLIWATKKTHGKTQRFDPPNACAIALNRKTEVLSGKYRSVPHAQLRSRNSS